MTVEEQIETDEAKRLRNARQHFAAPGGSHDRLVTFLGKALPMAVGMVAALMVITPLSPRGEVSFLLDKNKVAMINERLRLSNAMYRGQDNRGRPFSLTAASAVQRSSEEGIVRMSQIVGRILLTDGPAQISAPAGQYDIRSEVVTVDGAIRVFAADGYKLVASGVSLNLPERILVGNDGVSGEVPAGTFSADRLIANLAERTITLDGNARLRMIPGKLEVPTP
ncbi:LPS export ABC transporter periplasmic protein LptC [Tsuneonella mangrovi]|uniref:LPS export ABC transporter periplasmic protein LptC n=1 Tax=Tsuneonella mangrovi TaxID=1982042 RepID=UPI000BA1F11A|nr:LPS export ABC transporter periplasmic protein LptC [Tsuneonella mangrovi]